MKPQTLWQLQNAFDEEARVAAYRAQLAAIRARDPHPLLTAAILTAAALLLLGLAVVLP